MLKRMTECLKQNIELATKSNFSSESKLVGDRVKRIFFVRHGETDFNVIKCVQGRGINSQINEEGKRQARLLGKRLSSVPLDLVVTSTLRRAVETTEIILQMHPNPPSQVHKYEELEEMYFGDMEGKSFDPEHPDGVETIYPDLRKILDNWQTGNLEAKAPNGESPLQVERRIKTAVEKIFSLDFSNALVVCHGRLLKVLLCSLLRMGLENMYKLDQDNTAVNILESVDGKEFSSVVLNCTNHLKEQS